MKAILSLILIGSMAQASDQPTLSYDLGVSTGSQGNRNYSEIQLGLNWNFFDSLTWRNSLFNRSGVDIDSVSGLDSSVLFKFDSQPDEQGIGFSIFAGPGIRISNTENTGVFGEAGAAVKAAGLSIGGGIKTIQYSSPGRDSTGRDLSKNDTVVFLILAGSGSI